MEAPTVGDRQRSGVDHLEASILQRDVQGRGSGGEVHPARLGAGDRGHKAAGEVDHRDADAGDEHVSVLRIDDDVVRRTDREDGPGSVGPGVAAVHRGPGGPAKHQHHARRENRPRQTGGRSAARHAGCSGERFHR